MEPIGSTTTSVLNQLTPRNNPEDGRIRFNRHGSLRGESLPYFMELHIIQTLSIAHLSHCTSMTHGSVFQAKINKIVLVHIFWIFTFSLVKERVQMSQGTEGLKCYLPSDLSFQLSLYFFSSGSIWYERSPTPTTYWFALTAPVSLSLTHTHTHTDNCAIRIISLVQAAFYTVTEPVPDNACACIGSVQVGLSRCVQFGGV